nr:GDSL-type esterase/lipase family protein [Kribbella qitaiheensis]
MRRLSVALALIAGLLVITTPAAQAVPAVKTLRVMPLGDSITAGVGSPTSSSYRRPLAALIGGQTRYAVNFVGSQASGNLADLSNEGHSGWIIDQVRAEIDGWLAAARPDVVLLHLGINDLNRNVDVPNAPARFRGLVDRIVADKPGVTVIVLGLIPTTPGLESKVATFNAAVKSALTNPKTRYVDPPALTSAEMADGLHPNDAGFQRMAQAFYPALDRAYSDGVIAAAPALNAGNEAGGSGKIRWADFDGDGRMDYLTVASNGAVQAFLNRGGDGHGGWAVLGQVAGGVTADATRVRFADFDGDSRADYLVINANGSVSAWLNRGGDGPRWLVVDRPGRRRSDHRSGAGEVRGFRRRRQDGLLDDRGLRCRPGMAQPWREQLVGSRPGGNRYDDHPVDRAVRRSGRRHPGGLQHDRGRRIRAELPQPWRRRPRWLASARQGGDRADHDGRPGLVQRLHRRRQRRLRDGRSGNERGDRVLLGRW